MRFRWKKNPRSSPFHLWNNFCKYRFQFCTCSTCCKKVNGLVTMHDAWHVLRLCRFKIYFIFAFWKSTEEKHHVNARYYISVTNVISISFEQHFKTNYNQKIYKSQLKVWYQLHGKNNYFCIKQNFSELLYNTEHFQGPNDRYWNMGNFT